MRLKDTFCLILLVISVNSFSQIDKHHSISKIDGENCTTKYFYNRYSNPAHEVISTDMCFDDNDELLVCGSVRNINDDGFIMKLDSRGIKLWEITIGGTESQGFVKIIKLADGNFMSFGYDNAGGIVTIFLLKLTNTGTILWRKDYRIGTSSSFGFVTLKEDIDGSIIAVTSFLENLSFTDRMLFLKFSPAGDVLISTFYRPPGSLSLIYAGECTIIGDFIYIVGSHLVSSFQGLLMKVNKNNGNLEWTKTYRFNNGDAFFSHIFPFGSNQFCIAGSDNINETDTSLVLITDMDGNVQAANYFRYDSPHERGIAILDPEKKIIWCSYLRAPAGTTAMVISKIDPLNGALWVKNYPQIAEFPRSQRILFAMDSSLIVTGYANGANGLFGYLGRFSKNGDYGCAPDLLSATFGPGTTTLTNHSFVQSGITLTPVARTTTAIAPLVTEIDSVCYTSFMCDTISLSQPSPVCNFNDTIRIAVTTNSGCFILPGLTYDMTHLRLISFSSGVAKFVALREGYSIVKATLQTNCSLFKDSVSVLSHQSSLLSFGPDTSLCPGNSIVLNAGKGFGSYLWQDGSTDSLFTVTMPGIYHIEVQDSCGAVFRDTIIVNAAPPAPFSIGPDRIKCNSDTIHINAPSGFLNYSWSPPYNISPVTAQNVIVKPLIDTNYTVIAEKTPGCFVYDTIKITVLHSPSIDLGTDKSICLGDSAMLNAGAGFSQYLWNTGAAAQQIIVRTAGNYSVTATTMQGCKSYDTLKIINVFALPVVSLDHDSTLCSGDSKTLDAGSGFISYRWNNGSNQQTFPANTIGVYSVTVIDNNGCKGSDTAIINTIFPLPAAFLPPDTAICSYGTLLLKPMTSYVQYLWNSGAATPALVISQPGLYWLQVKDNNGCNGRDSVRINPKECLKGFYIPSAFTPNGDDKNDIYKPVLLGNILKYKFMIYNRWGQIVFRATDINKGWDGTYSGSKQDANVFVWTCTYQLEGEETKTEKGTVVLIR